MLGSLFDSHETEGYCPLRALPTREGGLTKAPVGHAGEAGSLKKTPRVSDLCTMLYDRLYVYFISQNKSPQRIKSRFDLEHVIKKYTENNI